MWTSANYLTFLWFSFLMWKMETIKAPESWGCLMVTWDNSCILWSQNMLRTVPVLSSIKCWHQCRHQMVFPMQVGQLPHNLISLQPEASGICPHLGTTESWAISLECGLWQLRTGARCKNPGWACVLYLKIGWQVLLTVASLSLTRVPSA